MDVRRHATGTPWEPVVGYSRAVQAGPLVFVAGCTSTDAQGTFVDGDAAAQTRTAIANVAQALEAVGTTLASVVQTRIYVRDIAAWEEVGRAHGEAFASIRPASTMIEVSGLIDPRMRVEIEAVAYDAALA